MPPSEFRTHSPSSDSSAGRSPSPSSSATSFNTSPRAIFVASSPDVVVPLKAITHNWEAGAGAFLLLCVPSTTSDVAGLKHAIARLSEITNENGALWEPSDKFEQRNVHGTSFKYLASCETGSDGVDALSHSNACEIPDAKLLVDISHIGMRRVVALPQAYGWTLHLLEKPSICFPALRCHNEALSTTPFGVPTLDEWAALWNAWDMVTLAMIPHDMLHDKPIDLRHKCLFYIGHIPTFLDMLLSKALKEPNTEPKSYTQIFERGIDPHVDDPDHCHNHSEVPEKDEDWPTLFEILAFRDRVRARLRVLYTDIQSGKRTISRRLARTLMMTLEHEGFHIETLLYMLIQRAGTGTLPPCGFTPPPWSHLVEQWSTISPASNDLPILGPARIKVGHNDSEADDDLFADPADVKGHDFGWDNESPERMVEVGKFKAEWRPVTNGEFHDFWHKSDGAVAVPASWVKEGDDIRVRTLHGPVPFAVARDWPVLTSYDDLLIYARSKGGRLPTEPELRLFLDTYSINHAEGANVGFRTWHPQPATMGVVDVDGGRGSNGGVWEWTSTHFAAHEGMVPTKLFPGYSADFFDGVHHVVLGASYATIPRLADRRTVRNFYQHNYPYPWVGARVVYDV